MLVGLCDYTFMDIYVGWPGSVHDAHVLTNSKLFQEAEAGTLLPNTTKPINGIDVPLLILGDPAYLMLPWLMKPYSDNGRLTTKQLRFNYRLSRARMVVECAFGRLKGRWRSLLKCNDTNVKFLPKYIANENAPTANTQTTGVSNSSVEADAIREALSDFFLAH